MLPASFADSAPDRRYPVTIVLDGEDNVPPVAAVSDELSRNGQIPESVIVAIPNTDRLRDLTPPGLSVSGSSLNEGGDRFLDFIEQELLPAVDLQFRGGGSTHVYRPFVRRCSRDLPRCNAVDVSHRHLSRHAHPTRR